MPNYVTYDPASTPVAGRVTGFLKSFPEDREDELSNFIKDPITTGITLNESKVIGGVLQNLSDAEKTLIASTQSSASKAELIAAAKGIFLTPTSADHQAIKLGFATFADIMLSEINALRTNAGLAPRTLNQLNTAFKNGVEAKIDAP